MSVISDTCALLGNWYLKYTCLIPLCWQQLRLETPCFLGWQMCVDKIKWWRHILLRTEGKKYLSGELFSHRYRGLKVSGGYRKNKSEKKVGKDMKTSRGRSGCGFDENIVNHISKTIFTWLAGNLEKHYSIEHGNRQENLGMCRMFCPWMHFLLEHKNLISLITWDY